MVCQKLSIVRGEKIHLDVEEWQERVNSQKPETATVRDGQRGSRSVH